MAVATYLDANGHYPPAFVRGPDGRPWHSWRVLILPFIEGHKIYERYDFNEPWDGPNNRRLAGERPNILAFSGTDRAFTTTNYLAVVGPDTLWPGAEGRKKDDVTDGTSTTILIVENDGIGVHWMEPRDLDFATMSFEVGSPEGVSSWYKEPAVVTADDTVRRLSREMTPEALRAALTARGGEELTGGWEVIPDGRLRERADPKP